MDLNIGSVTYCHLKQVNELFCAQFYYLICANKRINLTELLCGLNKLICSVVKTMPNTKQSLIKV